MKYVYPTRNLVRYRFPTHVNDLVLDRKDSQTSEVFVVVLQPGEAPPMHKHDDTEQVFYVTEGKGLLEIKGQKRKMPVAPGDVVRVPAKTFHRIFCQGNKPLVYIAVDCFVDGRPKAEPTWESHVKGVCKQQGWDFAQIKQKRRAPRIAAQ